MCFLLKRVGRLYLLTYLHIRQFKCRLRFPGASDVDRSFYRHCTVSGRLSARFTEKADKLKFISSSGFLTSEEPIKSNNCWLGY